MAYTEAAKKAADKYKKANIKRIPLDVQIEEYEQYKQAADEAGESLNGYIKKAIKQRMNN